MRGGPVQAVGHSGCASWVLPCAVCSGESSQQPRDWAGENSQ